MRADKPGKRPAPRANARVAIAQVKMHWTIEKNLASIVAAMRVAREQGAGICAFSELAVTGFHREIVNLAKPQLIEPAVATVRAEARRLQLAVAIGAPTFGPEGARRNSHLLIDESGQAVAVVEKNGLTAPEATFFQAGTTRPSGKLQGLASTAVICREIEDRDLVLQQMKADPVSLIFWPGQMRPDPDKPFTDPPAHVVRAQELARESGSYVIQTNWPNALNRPEESRNTGHSACIAPSGELLFRLPREGFGVGIFDLGQATYQWHAQA